MGGMYIANMYEQVLMNQEVDIAVIGEGETTLLDLVRSLDNGKPVEEVEGIALRQEDRVIRTPPRPFIQGQDGILAQGTEAHCRYIQQGGVIGLAAINTTKSDSRIFFVHRYLGHGRARDVYPTLPVRCPLRGQFEQ